MGKLNRLLKPGGDLLPSSCAPLYCFAVNLEHPLFFVLIYRIYCAAYQFSIKPFW